MLILVVKIISMTFLHRFLDAYYSQTVTFLKSEGVIQSKGSHNPWASIKAEFFHRRYMFLSVTESYLSL